MRNFNENIQMQHPVNLTMTSESLMEFVNEFCKQTGLVFRETDATSLKNTEGKIYLSEEETMKRLRVSHSTLWRWRNNGYLIPRKVGKFNRYAVSDIEKIEEGG